MKLTLINFRCHANLSVQLDANKFTLISGRSGAGKSSILMALDFAFKNEGRKIIRRGSKFCQVVVEDYDDKLTFVMRRKTPCRLVIAFGGKEYEDNEAQAILDREITWNVGYVKQQYYKSFIFMSPSDKLTFVRNMLNNDYISRIVQRSKELYATRKSAFDKLSAEKSTLKEFISTTSHHSDDEQTSVEDEQTLLEDEPTLVAEQRRLVDAKKVRDDKLREVEFLYRELESIVVPTIDDDDESRIDERIANANRATDIKRLRSELSEIRNDRIKTLTSDYEIAFKRYATLLNRYDANLRGEKAYVLLRCPSCKASLKYYAANDLEICDIECSGDGGTDVDAINRHNKLIVENDHIYDEILSIEEKYDKSLLRGKAFSAYKRYAELNRKLMSLLPPPAFMDDDVERLKTLRREILVRRERLRRKDDLNCRLRNIVVPTVDEDRLSAVENKLEKCKAYKRVVKYKQVVVDTTRAEKRLYTASRLKTLVNRAEILTISSVVESINNLVNFYISDFFPADSSFSARLELADDKLALNIYDDDYESVDVQYLSGGESVRVILAFTLALCEINRVTTLYLDEILSPIDEETTSSILAFIRRRFDGIVCVSHQATRGIFDVVIDL